MRSLVKRLLLIAITTGVLFKTPALLAAVTAPQYGWGGCKWAPLWTRHDEAPSTILNPSPATGGTSTWHQRIPKGPGKKTAAGTLIEFAEARERDNDHGCRAIWCRRSTDDGETWSTPIEVYRLPTYEYDVDYINAPAPWVESDGTVGLLFTRKTNGTPGRRIYETLSSDDGRTWSAPTEITSSVTFGSTLYTASNKSIADSGADAVVTSANHGLTDGKTYKITITGASVAAYNTTWTVTSVPDANTFVLTGGAHGAATGATWEAQTLWHITTGNGIELATNGSGKQGWVVVPCNHRYTDDNSGISFSHWLARNPSTGAWSLMGRLTETTAANQGSNECEVCELAGGTLMSIIRINNDGNKGYSFSYDQGATWDNMLVADGGGGRPNIDGTECDSSLISLSTGEVYLSYASETQARGGVAICKLTVTETNPATFTADTTNQKYVWRYLSGYSQLTALDSSNIMLSFERGHDLHYYNSGATSYEEIGIFRCPKAFIADSVTAPTYVRTIDWYFNEGTAGVAPQDGAAASPNGGRQIRCFGDYDQRGYGQATSMALFASSDNGFVIDNTTNNPPILAPGIHASRSTPMIFEPGFGSMIWEFEVKPAASTTTQRIWLDTRDSTGRGVTIGYAAITHRPACTVNDGTTTLNLTPTSGTYDDAANQAAFNVFRFEYIRGGTCRVLYNGTAIFSTADTLSASVCIRGSTSGVLGRRATATSLAANSTIRRMRVTIGTSVVSPMTSGETKPSLASLYGATTTVPANAPTSTGRVLWYADRYSRGYYSRTDYSGGFNPPRLPVIHGQGITSYTDPVGGLRFASISDDGYGAQHWERDPNLGLMIRHLPNAVAGGLSRMQLTALSATLDVPQNTGTFTLFGAIKVVQSAGSAGTIVGNTLVNTEPGFRLYRTSGNKVGFFLTKGASTNWVNLSSGFTNSPNLTPGCYFICVRGNVSTIQLSYAPISGGAVGKVTHLATEAMTDRTGTWASVNKLTWGMSHDGSAVLDCGLADWMLYSTVLNDAAVNAAATFIGSRVGGKPLSIGLGIGLTDNRDFSERLDAAYTSQN